MACNKDIRRAPTRSLPGVVRDRPFVWGEIRHKNGHLSGREVNNDSVTRLPPGSRSSLRTQPRYRFHLYLLRPPYPSPLASVSLARSGLLLLPTNPLCSFMSRLQFQTKHLCASQNRKGQQTRFLRYCSKYRCCRTG